MFKILHHNDDDGRCAAFIIKRFALTLVNMTPDDFIEYNNSGDLTKRYPEITEGDTVYIVDISLSDAVLGFIQHVVNNGGYIIHIDHHASGIKYYEDNKKLFDDMGDHYAHLFRNGISGTMLCWIYTEVFNQDDQEHPENAMFDFDDDDMRNKCSRVNKDHQPVDDIDDVIKDDRLVKNIPAVVRFIDDNDIFKHKIPETLSFSFGFKLVENKHPLSQVWVELFDQSDPRGQNDLIRNIISNGDIVLQYRNATDARILSNGFLVNINGIDVCCLNTPEGNSMIFQDMYDFCDAVCKYSFDGVKWWYTFYSNNDGANVLDIINYLRDTYGAKMEYITGGGHCHAGGCTFYRNVLSLFTPDKTSFIEKRKEIRIEKEVAAEQRRIEEEQKKLQEEADKLARIRAKITANTPDDEDDESYDGI